ncbi:hypothetical protein [Nocardioides sp. CER19]|uniref:hypothetical protein n=1 Tax=Nocardioides sp. CER19 TaxID=3038538 RepID=UPI00244C2D22|nr:hypothetical protein [Nocardioides sp. CER19]MDH2414174.1 hypothetical protein [Nocardioides sp. CER19]
MARHGVPGPRSRAVPTRRRIVLAGVACGMLGVIVILALTQHDSSQRSTALLDLSSALARGSSTSGPTTDQADRFVQSQLVYLNSRGFERTVLAISDAPAGTSVSASQVGSTNVVQISATAPNRAAAVHAADAAVSAYRAHRRQVVNQADALAAAGGTVMEDARDAGAKPTTSRPLVLGVGLAAGVLLGLVVAALPLLLARREWSEEEASDADSDVAVAAPALPTASEDWRDGLLERPSDDPLECASRLLSARLVEQMSAPRPLVVVGATSGVGASFVAVNLATAFARRGRTVLIAAGDVRNGTVGRWFNLPPDAQSLLHVARTDAVSAVESALCETPVSNLFVLPVSPSARWDQMEQALSGSAVSLLLHAGWRVVIDCPPATQSTAVFEVSRCDPVVVLVVDRDVTTPEELTAAFDQLPGDGSAATVVVNERPAGGRRTERDVG